MQQLSRKRKSGISAVGDVEWGAHMCQFYRSKQDLVDILVPYFKAGLESNEFCVWVVSDLSAEEAKDALKSAVNDLNERIGNGQMEIIDYDQWYVKSGRSGEEDVPGGWAGKEELAMKKGFDGLRMAGNMFWREKKDWKSFAEYRSAVNSMLRKRRIIAICTYSLESCDASKIIDIIGSHGCAIVKHDGGWGPIESPESGKREEALQREKEFSENILRTMPDGLDIVDENLKIVYMNKTLEDAFGKDSIGKKCYEVYRADEKQCENCPLKSPLNGGTKMLEVSGIRNGRTFLISHTSILLNGERRVLEIFSDVTERKKLEEDLLKLSHAVEQSHASIVITNTEGTIEYVNPYFTEATGYSREEAVGQNPRMLKSGKQPEDVYKKMWRTIKSGEHWHGEFCNRKKNGELFWERVSVSPVKNKSGEIIRFVAVKEDITRHKKIEEEIEKSLKEKEVLLKEIHHRVKNNLQLIASLLRLQAASAGEHSGLLKDSQSRIRSIALVHEILYQTKDFTSIVATNYLKTLASELNKLYNVHEISIHVDAEPVTLEINAAIPCGLIVNELILNSIKHAFHGKGGRIGVSLRAAGNGIELVVEDNGKGLPESFDMENMESLGLQLVKSLTDQLDGTMEISSAKGTRVRITFPRKDPYEE